MRLNRMRANFLATVASGILILFSKVWLADSHPICLDDSEPRHRSGSETFRICKQFENFGCCDAARETKIYDRYKEMIVSASSDCSKLLEDVLCQECSPLAGHIYLTNYHHSGSKRGLYPGMCKDYCSTFYDTCFHVHPFSDTHKSEFCKILEAEDEYYCYPFVESYGKKQEQKITPGCIKMCFEEIANRIFQPISAKSPNDGTNRFFVAEQKGMIWIYLANRTKIISPPFLDISDRTITDATKYDERGVVDFVFHPNFKENGRFFVFYCFKLKGILFTRISQFKVSAQDMNKAETRSEKILMEIKQDGKAHNGGSLLFGTDGYLYISVGDGGNMKDLFNRGQTISGVLGKILRIDVDVPEGDKRPYLIPHDNPFITDPVPGARPEIFATGIRNAWRCSMDRGDSFTGEKKGRLFCADVGSSKYEEINLIEKGKNYGWRVMEGFHCSPKSQPGECTNASIANYTLPLVEYSHQIMDCVIGGFVYRGCQNPVLQGLYISAGLRRGWLQGIREDSDGSWFKQSICPQKKHICKRYGMTNDLPFNVLSFAEDDDGELYILATSTPGPGFSGGRILKLKHTPDENEKSSEDICSASKPYKETILAPYAKLENYSPIPRVKARLMNWDTQNNRRGRLEIRLEGGEWGTVCNKSFSQSSAIVACAMVTRKISFASIEDDVTSFGKGSGNIWLSNLKCRGNEESLFNCYHDGWGKAKDCSHDDDVAIFCGSRRSV